MSAPGGGGCVCSGDMSDLGGMSATGGGGASDLGGMSALGGISNPGACLRQGV